MQINTAPQLVHREQALQIVGIRTRTTNQDEASPTSGKIAPLWQRFFADRVAQSIPAYTPQSPLYGVYSGYASDAHGAYDLTAGVASDTLPDGLESEGLVSVLVPPGPFLLFEGQGDMPQTVVAVWQAVWRFFENQPSYARRYAADFEQYSGEGKIAVYIGVALP